MVLVERDVRCVREVFGAAVLDEARVVRRGAAGAFRVVVVRLVVGADRVLRLGAAAVRRPLPVAAARVVLRGALAAAVRVVVAVLRVVVLLAAVARVVRFGAAAAFVVRVLRVVFGAAFAAVRVLRPLVVDAADLRVGVVRVVLPRVLVPRVPVPRPPALRVEPRIAIGCAGRPDESSLFMCAGSYASSLSLKPTS